MDIEEIDSKIAVGDIAKHVQTICDTIAMPLMHKLVLRQAERILNDQAAEITRLRAELAETALQAIASEGQAAEAYAAQLKAEAERDAAITTAIALADDADEKAYVEREIASAIRTMKENKT